MKSKVLAGDLTRAKVDLNIPDSRGETITLEAWVDDLVVTAISANTDYAAWAGPSGFNLSGGQAADDDNDGLSNHEGIRLRPDPEQRRIHQPDHRPTRQIHRQVQLHPPQHSCSAPASPYSVWFSVDLHGWTQDTPANAVVTPIPSTDNETVEVTLSPLPGNPLPDTLFIQVRAN